MPTDEELRRAQQLDDITMALSRLEAEKRIGPKDHAEARAAATAARLRHDDERLTCLHRHYCTEFR